MTEPVTILAVDDQPATLERFTGDGLMVFFNDPIPLDKPAQRAVGMALSMRDRVRTLAEGWSGVGHYLGFGVGIAQGFATLGRIGDEGVSTMRRSAASPTSPPGCAPRLALGRRWYRSESSARSRTSPPASWSAPCSCEGSAASFERSACPA